MDELDDSADDDDVDRESEPFHPVDRELEVSRTYADPEAFTDDDITDRLHHYTEVQEHADLLPRQREVLDRVVARIVFEFARRMEEEFGPRSSDDLFLEAYEDPGRVERDFEDPHD